MTTEAVQPQTPFFQQEVVVRTPEEIMVTLLAQTIIMNSMPTPQLEMELPYQMDKPQEKTQDRASTPGQEPTKEPLNALQRTSHKSAEESPTRSTKAPETKQQGESHLVAQPQPIARELSRAEQLLQRLVEGEKAVESHQTTREATQQLLSQGERVPKPLTPPPPHESRIKSEQPLVLKERGTSRRAMPQLPQHHNRTTHNPLFEKSVNKEREEQQRKRGDFTQGRAKKIDGRAKISRVADAHFKPPSRNEYESFLRTMMQDSDLSDFFNKRISHFDVLLLFIELMKLEIEDNQSERTARLEERRYQISWMESVVKEYKSQAKFLLYAGIGAGVLGVLSGALPIIGHVGGDFILSKLSMVYKGFEGMKRVKFFDNLSKICFATSEMNKAMGQVQSSFCEGERSWAEHKSSLHRTDGEESTRTIEERTREFKNWNDILAQLLRMEQDLVRQLYQ